MASKRLGVVETFVSIEGEGPRAGLLTTFIRFAGCNLQCPYCDTKYANDESAAVTWYTPESLLKVVEEYNVKSVSLTGGEPLLQDFNTLYSFMEMLDTRGYKISVETNGSVPLAPWPGYMHTVMDIKSPSSGMSKKMHYANMGVLHAKDAVKFVVGDIYDLQNMVNVLYAFPTRAQVYVSPEFGKIDLQLIAEFLVKFRLKNVRMQLQLHKIIWDPEARGV